MKDFEPFGMKDIAIYKPFLNFVGISGGSFKRAKGYYEEWVPLNEQFQKKLASVKSFDPPDDGFIDAQAYHAKHMVPIETELYECCIITIVFAALAVEGYIYYYAIKNLPWKFVDDHLDKLDVLSKWLVIPQLVTGKEFPKDGHAFQLLKQLISNRNYIVHSKAAHFSVFDEKKKEPAISKHVLKGQEFEDNLFKHAENAIKALDELSLVMGNIDPEERSSGVFGAKKVAFKMIK